MVTIPQPKPVARDGSGEKHDKYSPPQPSHGTVFWVPQDEYGRARININGREYTLVKVDGAFVQWELSYLSDKWEMVCHTVTPYQAGWTCSCPFAKEKLQGHCKHIRGLRAALSKLSYPV